MNAVLLYLTDSMADWETGYVTGGFAFANEERPRFGFLTVAENTEPVSSMGGVRLLPDITLADVEPADLAMLVLPGAQTWESGHDQVLDLAEKLIAAGTPVAAICGATLGLARRGLLDERAHTSNAPEFLTAAENYKGQAHYRAERAVSDGPVITAGGTAPLEFAREVFAALQAFPPDVLDAWYGLYSTGEQRFYDRLTGAGS